MVRLKDIAERAAVSVMTVSKALRDEPDVSAATKARIKLLAQQMGYVPDSSAQGLRTRTTRLFGVIIPTSSNPIYALAVAAIEQRAHELGYDILLAHSHNLPEREESCIRRLLSRRVDGIFISPVYRMDPEVWIYKELQARRTPVVLLGPSAPFCNQFFSIDTDDHAGSYTATQHLLKLGHRRIAFLSGPLAAPWAHERLEGYRRALREAELEIDDRLIFKAGATIEDGAAAALQMLNESCEATAAQAVTDLVAIGCALTFLEQGIRIPEELSLIGYGNLLTAENFRVPLTTVRQPKTRLGEAAMDAMAAIIRGQRPEPKRVSAEFIVRASTASPPSASRLYKAQATASPADEA